MIRLLAIAAALSSTAAGAQSAYYVATPAAPATRAVVMTRDTPWRLRNGAYVADRAPERDAVLCELVARGAGRLAGFTVAGKPYDAAALAKCNARVK